MLENLRFSKSSRSIWKWNIAVKWINVIRNSRNRTYFLFKDFYFLCWSNLQFFKWSTHGLSTNTYSVKCDIFPGKKTHNRTLFHEKSHRFTEKGLCYKCLFGNLLKLFITLGNKYPVNVNLFTFTKEIFSSNHFVQRCGNPLFLCFQIFCKLGTRFRDFLCKFKANIFALFRMDLFGATHGWGRGKKEPSLKSVTCILPWWNLAQLYLTKRWSKKHINHVTQSLSFADIGIFSPEISNFCRIKKCRFRLHFST